jgi:hypothetical protein
MEENFATLERTPTPACPRLKMLFTVLPVVFLSARMSAKKGTRQEMAAAERQRRPEAFDRGRADIL